MCMMEILCCLINKLYSPYLLEYKSENGYIQSLESWDIGLDDSNGLCNIFFFNKKQLCNVFLRFLSALTQNNCMGIAVSMKLFLHTT